MDVPKMGEVERSSACVIIARQNFTSYLCKIIGGKTEVAICTVELARKHIVKQVEADRRVKLEIQKLTTQRILSNEKLKVKEKDLQLEALKEKIGRLEDGLEHHTTLVI